MSRHLFVTEKHNRSLSDARCTVVCSIDAGLTLQRELAIPPTPHIQSDKTACLVRIKGTSTVETGIFVVDQ